MRRWDSPVMQSLAEFILVLLIIGLVLLVTVCGGSSRRPAPPFTPVIVPPPCVPVYEGRDTAFADTLYRGDTLHLQAVVTDSLVGVSGCKLYRWVIWRAR